MNIILEHIPEILIGLVFVIAVVFFIIRYVKSTPEQKKKIIADIIYALALKAEQEYGSKTGQAKKKQVIAWFYEKYPALSYILSEDELGSYIDDVVGDMNEYLKNNPDAARNILGISNEELDGETDEVK